MTLISLQQGWQSHRRHFAKIVTQSKQGRSQDFAKRGLENRKIL